ncbi:M23 family metallopeptidase [Streptomyces sp. NPDC051315]|uniref:M23 family metallopeptidase n=1 Tax=Streptomyces sp. NPDC051315 TaxID=3365650 RepID=UPI0037985F35
MRREHSARHSAAATFLAAALLVALAAVPAGAGSDALRERAARVVRAHEQARERADRLRAAHTDADAGTAHTAEPRPDVAAGAADTEAEAAERRRKALRAELWDLLWTRARDAGDPVAVDASGQAGHCTPDRTPAPARGRPSKRDGAAARSRSSARDGAAARAAAPRPAARTEAGTRAGAAAAWTAPTRGYWLSAGYAERGSRWAHRHTGQDFAVPTGTPVYAVGPGVVRATTCGDGFGRQVLVRHPDGYFTQYAHLSRIDVRKGQRVGPGRRLGLSGATGNVTGPHLHFEVRITPYMGSAVPPLEWLRRKAVEVVPGAPGD